MAAARTDIVGIETTNLDRPPGWAHSLDVFSCFNQDRALDRVAFFSLRRRLGQNRVPVKLTRHWIDRGRQQIGWRPTAAES